MTNLGERSILCFLTVVLAVAGSALGVCGESILGGNTVTVGAGETWTVNCGERFYIGQQEQGTGHLVVNGGTVNITTAERFCVEYNSDITLNEGEITVTANGEGWYFPDDSGSGTGPRIFVNGGVFTLNNSAYEADCGRDGHVYVGCGTFRSKTDLRNECGGMIHAAPGNEPLVYSSEGGYHVYTGGSCGVKVGFETTSSGDVEAVSPVVLRVNLSSESEQTVTVDYAATGGTATVGADYVMPVGPLDAAKLALLADNWLWSGPAGGSEADLYPDGSVDFKDFAVYAVSAYPVGGALEFAAGETSKTISIEIVDDGLNEEDETIIIELSNPTGLDVELGENTQYTYTIVDPRPFVAFESATSSGREQEPSATVAVILSHESAEMVTVDYEVTGGTATGGGVDYTLVSGTLTFEPGVVTRQITVAISDDEIEEFPYETVEIALSNASANVKLGTLRQNTFSIIDDELQAMFVNGLGMKFLMVQPDATFTMGRAVSVGEAYSYEGPEHQVTMTKPFFIMEQTVSDSAYQQSGLGGSAGDVSWNNAMAFAEWLGNSVEGAGFTYRLPTEAEWDYLRQNPNAPMAGSVQGIGSGREWTNDWFAPFRGTDRVDPMGPAAGVMKVVRSDGARREPLAMNTTGRFGMGSMRFRLVARMQEPAQGDYDAPPFNVAAVKQNTDPAAIGPNGSTPYFHVRLALSIPPDTNKDLNGALVGLDGTVWSHNHSPGFTVLANGDVVACWFSGRDRSGGGENSQDTRFIWARLRYGSDIWEVPQLFYDTRMNEQSAALLAEPDGTLWSINGGRGNDSVRFKLAKSTDNGATWTSWFPESANLHGSITPQPIPMPFRDNDGNLYFAMDGEDSESFLWKSTDNGLTWNDQGGRTNSRHSTMVPIKDRNNRSASDPFVGVLTVCGKEGNRMQFSSNWGGSWGNWSYQHGWYETQSNQRPAACRLPNGNIAFAQDSANARRGEDGPNPFVAISRDEGHSWHVKRLPVARRHHLHMFSGAAGTLGYASVAGGANGIIHVLGTLSSPGLHYEFNEAWMFSGDGDMQPERTGGTVEHYTEEYPDGSLRAAWSARITPNGRYLLDGEETTYYPDGSVEYQAIYESGLRVTATYYAPNGQKVWTWDYNNSNNTAVWTRFWSNGQKMLESNWQTFASIGTTSGDRRFRGLLAHGDAVRYNRSGAETGRDNFNLGCRGGAWSCIDDAD